MSFEDTELREKLAAIEHERWADWQKYVHSKLLGLSPDGFYSLDSGYVNRWNKQIDTPYAKLSEVEKQSDRQQVDRYWPLIVADKEAAVRELATRLVGPRHDDHVGADELCETCMVWAMVDAQLQGEDGKHE